ncbi:class I SAM-dependent methyltransferase [Pseudochelatococcus sp. B33]
MLQNTAQTAMQNQRPVDGMMLEQSAAIWCFLLEQQHATWSWEGLGPGGYLEIGTFKGKAASVLATYSHAYGNPLTIVDPEIMPTARQTISALQPKTHFLQIRSEFLPKTAFYKDNLRNLAFAHIDGMHRFSAVMSDLRLCEDMLSDFGIISVDDFHTDLYPQIPAAVYRHLFSGPSDLSIFLIGFNKAYLCRNVAKKNFMQMVKENAQGACSKLLGEKLTIVKTDRNDGFDAYTLVGWQGEPTFGNEL